jgi:hypothetical protein
VRPLTDWQRQLRGLVLVNVLRHSSYYRVTEVGVVAVVLLDEHGDVLVEIRVGGEVCKIAIFGCAVEEGCKLGGVLVATDIHARLYVLPF